jgi:hypothetical protein
MELLPVKEDLKVFRNRCSCFDEDCADVKDHMRCFIGNEFMTPVDGYCPYLVGEAGPLNRDTYGKA